MRYCERHGNHFGTTCPTCRKHDKLRRISAYCRALRARLAEVEAELAREREDARDIPTIAYMSGAADWKARATRAEAELSAQAMNIITMTHMHDALRRSNEALTERAEKAEAELAKVREASALLVGEEIARANKAESERDEAMGRCERLEEVANAAHGHCRSYGIKHRRKRLVRALLAVGLDVRQPAFHIPAKAALAECGEGE